MPNPNLPAGWQDKIGHARIDIGGTTLMGADIPHAEPMRSAYMMLSFDGEQDAERVHAPASARAMSFGRRLCSIAFSASIAACALGQSGSFPADSAARAARDVPARFEPVAPTTRLAPADTISGNGCTSPVRDPRDGTELRLERAIAPRGDYVVPAGRYGSGPGDLLRLDCNTGTAIGFVRR